MDVRANSLVEADDVGYYVFDPLTELANLFSGDCQKLWHENPPVVASETHSFYNRTEEQASTILGNNGSDYFADEDDGLISKSIIVSTEDEDVESAGTGVSDDILPRRRQPENFSFYVAPINP